MKKYHPQRLQYQILEIMRPYATVNEFFVGTIYQCYQQQTQNTKYVNVDLVAVKQEIEFHIDELFDKKQVEYKNLLLTDYWNETDIVRITKLNLLVLLIDFLIKVADYDSFEKENQGIDLWKTFDQLENPIYIGSWFWHYVNKLVNQKQKEHTNKKGKPLGKHLKLPNEPWKTAHKDYPKYCGYKPDEFVTSLLDEKYGFKTITVIYYVLGYIKYQDSRHNQVVCLTKKQIQRNLDDKVSRSTVKKAIRVLKKFGVVLVKDSRFNHREMKYKWTITDNALYDWFKYYDFVDVNQFWFALFEKFKQQEYVEINATKISNYLKRKEVDFIDELDNSADKKLLLNIQNKINRVVFNENDNGLSLWFFQLFRKEVFQFRKWKKFKLVMNLHFKHKMTYEEYKAQEIAEKTTNKAIRKANKLQIKKMQKIQSKVNQIFKNDKIAIDRIDFKSPELIQLNFRKLE